MAGMQEAKTARTFCAGGYWARRSGAKSMFWLSRTRTSTAMAAVRARAVASQFGPGSDDPSGHGKDKTIPHAWKHVGGPTIWCGADRIGLKSDNGHSLAARVKDWRAQAEDQKGDSQAGHREVRDRDIQPGHVVRESLQLRHVRVCLGELDGHFDFPDLSKTFVKYRSKGTRLVQAITQKHIGKRAGYVFKNSALCWILEAVCLVFESKSSLTASRWASIEGGIQC